MTTTITFALAATLLAGIAMAQTVNFDSFATGAPPPGLSTAIDVVFDPDVEVAQQVNCTQAANLIQEAHCWGCTWSNKVVSRYAISMRGDTAR